MWRCQYCETFNKDENTVCEVCGNSKGSQAGMPKAESAYPHVIMQQPDTGFTGSGSAPVYGSGSVPVSGSGSAPVYGSGSVPVSGSGSAPVYGSGSVPVSGSGSAPVHGTGSTPVAETPEPEKSKKRTEKKKGTWAIWLIIVLIVLVAGGTVSWVMFEDEIRTFIADMTGKELETENEGDAVSTENTASVGGGFFGISSVENNAEVVPAFSGAQYVNAESSAEDIAYIQDILQKLGLLNTGSYTPGVYDDATTAAVLGFQQRVNSDSGYEALKATGECDAATLVYFAQYNANNVPAAPKVLSASFNDEFVMYNTDIAIYAQTELHADALTLYDENGEFINSWDAATYSHEENGNRVWNLTQQFSKTGSRSFSLCATTDRENYGPAAQLSIYVFSLDISSVSFDAPEVVCGQARMITATTPVEARYLIMCDTYGNRLNEWFADDCSYDDGANRIWTVECFFTVEGAQDFIFVASNDGTTTGSSMTASIIVTPDAPDIISASFSDEFALYNTDAFISAQTELSADVLTLYDENNEYINSWDAATYSYEENGNRVWNLTQQFSKTGSRSLNLRATADHENYGSAYTINIHVFSLDVSSAYYDAPTVLCNQSRMITATTPVEARYLIMCDNYGNRLNEWYADDCSVSDDTTRTWNAECFFTVEGTHEFVFVASNDGTTIGSGVTATINVLPAYPAIHSAYFNKPVALHHEELLITAATDIHAAYLFLYNEDNEVLNSWDAATCSVEENGMRIWNITQPFGKLGDRYITLRAAAEGGEPGEAYGLTVRIITVDVSFVAFDSTTVIAGQQRMITANTPVDAQFLLMHNADGVQVRSWEALEYSVVDEETGMRIWNVPIKYSTVGTHDYIINGSYDGVAYGEGISTTITVLSKN